MLSSKELEDYISNIKKKERSDNKMCKAITELIQNGKEEGKIEGRLETLVNLVNNGLITKKTQDTRGSNRNLFFV